MNDQILIEIVDRLRNRFYGKYRGTVTKIEENGSGRIKARVPAVLGDQETGWCLPCLPYAGPQACIAFLPEEGAGVWIEFEGGDVSYPIWVGCYWHDGDKPDRVAPEVKVIKTKGNQLAVFDDKKHAIEIADSNGNRVTLDRTGVVIVRGKKKIEVKDSLVSVNDGAMEVT
jgi:uncharacterized protein involved in type VI secretion and phage assembly